MIVFGKQSRRVPSSNHELRWYHGFLTYQEKDVIQEVVQGMKERQADSTRRRFEDKTEIKQLQGTLKKAQQV